MKAPCPRQSASRGVGQGQGERVLRVSGAGRSDIYRSCQTSRSAAAATGAPKVSSLFASHDRISRLGPVKVNSNGNPYMGSQNSFSSSSMQANAGKTYSGMPPDPLLRPASAAGLQASDGFNPSDPPFQLKLIHVLLFVAILVGGVLYLALTLQLTSPESIEFKDAMLRVGSRLLNSIAFRQLLVIASLILLVRFGLNWLVRYFGSWTKVNFDRTKTYYVIKEVYQPLELLLFIAGVCTIADAFVPQLISVPKNVVSHFVRATLAVSFIVCAASMAMRFKRQFCQENAWQAEMNGDITSQRRWEAYDKLGTFAVYVLAFIFVVQAVGLEVTSVLAIGGVGGLAIGLAGREIFENLFNGFLILTSNPFEVGDEVCFYPNGNKVEGLVMDIGWYRTLIRSFEREVYIIPNAVFSKNTVLNITRKGREWRFFEMISVRVQDVSKVNAIVSDMRRIIKNDSRILNSLHKRVYLDKITMEDVKIYISFYVEAATRDVFMTIKQDFLLGFIDCMHRNGAQLAQRKTMVELVGPTASNPSFVLDAFRSVQLPEEKNILLSSVEDLNLPQDLSPPGPMPAQPSPPPERKKKEDKGDAPTPLEQKVVRSSSSKSSQPVSQPLPATAAVVRDNPAESGREPVVAGVAAAGMLAAQHADEAKGNGVQQGSMEAMETSTDTSPPSPTPTPPYESDIQPSTLTSPASAPSLPNPVPSTPVYQPISDSSDVDVSTIDTTIVQNSSQNSGHRRSRGFSFHSWASGLVESLALSLGFEPSRDVLPAQSQPMASLPAPPLNPMYAGENKGQATPGESGMRNAVGASAGENGSTHRNGVPNSAHSTAGGVMHEGQVARVGVGIEGHADVQASREQASSSIAGARKDERAGTGVTGESMPSSGNGNAAGQLTTVTEEQMQPGSNAAEVLTTSSVPPGGGIGSVARSQCAGTGAQHTRMEIANVGKDGPVAAALLSPPKSGPPKPPSQVAAAEAQLQGADPLPPPQVIMHTDSAIAGSSSMKELDRDNGSSTSSVDANSSSSADAGEVVTLPDGNLGCIDLTSSKQQATARGVGGTAFHGEPQQSGASSRALPQQEGPSRNATSLSGAAGAPAHGDSIANKQGDRQGNGQGVDVEPAIQKPPTVVTLPDGNLGYIDLTDTKTSSRPKPPAATAPEAAAEAVKLRTSCSGQSQGEPIQDAASIAVEQGPPGATWAASTTPGIEAISTNASAAPEGTVTCPTTAATNPGACSQQNTVAQTSPTQQSPVSAYSCTGVTGSSPCVAESETVVGTEAMLDATGSASKGLTEGVWHLPILPLNPSASARYVAGEAEALQAHQQAVATQASARGLITGGSGAGTGATAAAAPGSARAATVGTKGAGGESPPTGSTGVTTTGEVGLRAGISVVRLTDGNLGYIDLTETKRMQDTSRSLESSGEDLAGGTRYLSERERKRVQHEGAEIGAFMDVVPASGGKEAVVQAGQEGEQDTTTAEDYLHELDTVPGPVAQQEEDFFGPAGTKPRRLVALNEPGGEVASTKGKKEKEGGLSPFSVLAAALPKFAAPKSAAPPLPTEPSPNMLTMPFQDVDPLPLNVSPTSIHPIATTFSLPTPTTDQALSAAPAAPDSAPDCLFAPLTSPPAASTSSTAAAASTTPAAALQQAVEALPAGAHSMHPAFSSMDMSEQVMLVSSMVLTLNQAQPAVVAATEPPLRPNQLPPHSAAVAGSAAAHNPADGAAADGKASSATSLPPTAVAAAAPSLASATTSSSSAHESLPAANSPTASPDAPLPPCVSQLTASSSCSLSSSPHAQPQPTSSPPYPTAPQAPTVDSGETAATPAMLETLRTPLESLSAATTGNATLRPAEQSGMPFNATSMSTKHATTKAAGTTASIDGPTPSTPAATAGPAATAAVIASRMSVDCDASDTGTSGAAHSTPAALDSELPGSTAAAANVAAACTPFSSSPPSQLTMPDEFAPTPVGDAAAATAPDSRTSSSSPTPSEPSFPFQDVDPWPLNTSRPPATTGATQATATTITTSTPPTPTTSAAVPPQAAVAQDTSTPLGTSLSPPQPPGPLDASCRTTQLLVVHPSSIPIPTSPPAQSTSASDPPQVLSTGTSSAPLHSSPISVLRPPSRSSTAGVPPSPMDPTSIPLGPMGAAGSNAAPDSYLPNDADLLPSDIDTVTAQQVQQAGDHQMRIEGMDDGPSNSFAAVSCEAWTQPMLVEPQLNLQCTTAAQSTPQTAESSQGRNVSVALKPMKTVDGLPGQGKPKDPGLLGWWWLGPPPSALTGPQAPASKASTPLVALEVALLAQSLTGSLLGVAPENNNTQASHYPAASTQAAVPSAPTNNHEPAATSATGAEGKGVPTPTGHWVTVQQMPAANSAILDATIFAGAGSMSKPADSSTQDNTSAASTRVGLETPSPVLGTPSQDTASEATRSSNVDGNSSNRSSLRRRCNTSCSASPIPSVAQASLDVAAGPLEPSAATTSPSIACSTVPVARNAAAAMGLQAPEQPPLAERSSALPTPPSVPAQLSSQLAAAELAASILQRVVKAKPLAPMPPLPPPPPEQPSTSAQQSSLPDQSSPTSVSQPSTTADERSQSAILPSSSGGQVSSSAPDSAGQPSTWVQVDSGSPAKQPSTSPAEQVSEKAQSTTVQAQQQPASNTDLRANPSADASQTVSTDVDPCTSPTLLSNTSTGPPAATTATTSIAVAAGAAAGVLLASTSPVAPPAAAPLAVGAGLDVETIAVASAPSRATAIAMSPSSPPATPAPSTTATAEEVLPPTRHHLAPQPLPSALLDSSPMRPGLVYAEELSTSSLNEPVTPSIADPVPATAATGPETAAAVVGPAALSASFPQ